LSAAFGAQILVFSSDGSRTRSIFRPHRLWLSVIAYNLGNLSRRLVLPKRIHNWSLTSLLERLVKTGGRLAVC
jgi:hypothetical protein